MGWRMAAAVWGCVRGVSRRRAPRHIMKTMRDCVCGGLAGGPRPPPACRETSRVSPASSPRPPRAPAPLGAPANRKRPGAPRRVRKAVAVKNENRGTDATRHATRTAAKKAIHFCVVAPHPVAPRALAVRLTPTALYRRVSRQCVDCGVLGVNPRTER
eukprot:6134572-Prymnesium_polylepis.4